MSWLLRLFGIDDRETVDHCPYCHRPFKKPISLQRSAADAYIDGASIDWFEREVECELRRENG